jgi:hypothetical protein
LLDGVTRHSYGRVLKEAGRGKTSPNRSVYASPPVGGSGSKKPQSGCALCAVFLRHIASRRNATHCFMGGLQRHIQPERYASFCLKFVEIILKINHNGLIIING